MSHFSKRQLSSWSNKSLYRVLLDWTKSDSDMIYFYSQRGPISYAQAGEISTRLARYLCSNGKFSEKPILAASVDNAEYILYLIWACLASGICLAFLPRTCDSAQMRLLMDQVGASDLVTDIPELLGEPLFMSFEHLANTVFNHNKPVDVAGVVSALRPDTPAFIFQTSGTTGEAKWVQVSHGQFLAAIECLRRVGGLRHAINQIVYITPPLSHSYGLSSLLEYTLVGSAIILPCGSSPLGAVGELQDPTLTNIVTAIEGVPYFYSQMSRLIGRIKLPALRHIGLGGGGVDLTVINRIRNAYPKLSYSVRYGMTETPSVVSHKLFVHPYEDNWKSSGNILPIYELRIVDETGRTLVPYQEGEIQIKGDCLALPYYGETGESCGFFATGDIGYLDTNRELFIVGRKSLYLKNRGFRVSPEYIESVIGVFEGVTDCRVSMQDSGLLAEVVRLDNSFSTQDLLNFLSGKLPSYAMPEKVAFVGAIPRTPSGKIKR